eukprot:1478937-Rhodomonas_salina.2
MFLLLSEPEKAGLLLKLLRMCIGFAPSLSLALDALAGKPIATDSAAMATCIAPLPWSFPSALRPSLPATCWFHWSISSTSWSPRFRAARAWTAWLNDAS